MRRYTFSIKYKYYIFISLLLTYYKLQILFNILGLFLNSSNLCIIFNLLIFTANHKKSSDKNDSLLVIPHNKVIVKHTVKSIFSVIFFILCVFFFTKIYHFCILFLLKTSKIPRDDLWIWADVLLPQIPLI